MHRQFTTAQHEQNNIEVMLIEKINKKPLPFHGTNMLFIPCCMHASGQEVFSYHSRNTF